MTTAKNKKIIYWTLYGLIFVFTAYFAFTFISKSIAEKKDFEIFKESWQYVADTNFKQSVEIDPETNEQKIYYEISTPEQLAGAFLSESSVSAEDTETISNKTFILTNNVDLKGKTWSVGDFKPKDDTSSYPVFEGNSYHIQNLTINDNSISSSSTRILGFVGTLKGTIKNLYFDNLNVSTSRWDTKCYIGGIAGKMEGGQISNVYINSGYIRGSYLGTYSTFNQAREVGGIVGYLNGGTIQNSINKASLDYGKHIGGIVGYIKSGSVSNCINQGNVCASDGIYMRVGGIAGEINGGTLKLCENTGKIYTNIDEDEVNCTNLSIGGIAGITVIPISECSNRGNIEGGNEWACDETFAGGIVGYSSSNITDCYNIGDVTAYAYTRSSQVFNETYDGDPTQIDAFRDNFVIAVVYNQWRINRWYYSFLGKKRTKSITNAYAGGIIGKRKFTSNAIKNVYSLGTVLGGEIKYSDTYNYSFNYQQEFWTAGAYGATKYYEIAARKYSIDLSYTYAFLYNPIAGDYSNGVTYITNTAGSKDFTTTNKYSYRLTATDYFKKNFVPGWSIASLLISLFTETNKTSEYTSNYKNDYMYTNVSITGDKKLFNVDNLANVVCRIDASSSNISLKCKYDLTSTVKDERNKTGTGNENIMSQSLSQFTPLSNNYQVTSNASTILNKINSNSKWQIDNSKNSGYPIIKGLYW